MINAVILAAGSSSRLGRPKQNLRYQGNTLLQRAIIHAGEIADNILVVLGADESVVAPTLTDFKVQILSNPYWREGMASSIRLAITHLQNNDAEDRVLFMVCDQPFISAPFLDELKKTALVTGAGIVATHYGDTIGVPAIFSPNYHQELAQLSGDMGARQIISSHADDLITVTFSQAQLDIDTENDYRRLRELDDE